MKKIFLKFHFSSRSTGITDWKGICNVFQITENHKGGFANHSFDLGSVVQILTNP